MPHLGRMRSCHGLTSAAMPANLLLHLCVPLLAALSDQDGMAIAGRHGNCQTATMGCPLWATGHTTKVAAVAPGCAVCAASQVLKQLYLALFCSGSALPLSELLSQVLEADRPVNTQVWGNVWTKK